MTTEAVTVALLGLLADEGRKPPRVLARKVAEHLEALGLLADDPPEPGAAGELVLVGKRPDPPTWLRFVDTLPEGDVPVAVTRNRTDAALRHLGLDPDEVRALVVERDWLRVYRWSDRTESSGQTMPVLEETA